MQTRTANKPGGTPVKGPKKPANGGKNNPRKRKGSENETESQTPVTPNVNATATTVI